MATAAAALRRDAVKEAVYVWEGRDKTGKTVKGEMRASGEAVVNSHAAPPGHHRHQGRASSALPAARSQREGHRALHPPARDDDEGRRAAAAVLRHRRQGPRRIRAVAKLLMDIKSDVETGLVARRGVPQVPALLRRAVLQPGPGRRAGRYSGDAARPPRDLQGEDPRHQVEDQGGAVLPDGDASWWRSSSPR